MKVLRSLTYRMVLSHINVIVANVNTTLHLGDYFWAPPDEGRRVVVLKIRFIAKWWLLTWQGGSPAMQWFSGVCVLMAGLTCSTLIIQWFNCYLSLLILNVLACRVYKYVKQMKQERICLPILFCPEQRSEHSWVRLMLWLEPCKLDFGQIHDNNKYFKKTDPKM